MWKLSVFWYRLHLSDLVQLYQRFCLILRNPDRSSLSDKTNARTVPRIMLQVLLPTFSYYFVISYLTPHNLCSWISSNLRWCYSRWSPVLPGSLTEAATSADSLWWSRRLCCGGWTYHGSHACCWHRTKWLDAALTRASLLRTGSAPCGCSSNSMANIIQGWKYKSLWDSNIHNVRLTSLLKVTTIKTYLCNQ